MVSVGTISFFCCGNFVCFFLCLEDLTKEEEGRASLYSEFDQSVDGSGAVSDELDDTNFVEEGDNTNFADEGDNTKFGSGNCDELTQILYSGSVDDFGVATQCKYIIN